MALKTVGQNPKISDTVLLEMQCPGADGCFYSNPYMLNTVTVYYLQVDVVNAGREHRHERVVYDPAFQHAYEVARRAACRDPSDDNLDELASAQEQLEVNQSVETSYFSEAVPVLTLGTPDTPAWLDGDEGEAIVQQLDTDAKGERQYGHFVYQWNPLGMREGNYFLCWTWTPNPAGGSLTAYAPFTLFGDTQMTTSIPTHRAVPGKYEMLLDRYLPQLFKETQADNDLTPEVLGGFNKAVAQGFSLLEDMAAQLIDILNPNATPEALLGLLARSYGLQLYSRDPTLWRRQIGMAMPHAKRRGTLKGLRQGLSLAGVHLVKFTPMWQVVSRVTWQECFTVDADQTDFTLSKQPVLPINEDNFSVYWRAKGDPDWAALTQEYVRFAESGEHTVMTWIGSTVESDPFDLVEGDEIRVLYQVSEASEHEQMLENYVRTLPLMDQRDERDQKFPPKNWNTRLIEQDDPWLHRLIPTRHPFADPVQFGWVRTEFAYSENVYGMEEYDGSTRQSYVPCDIGKDFIEPGHGCLSSAFAIDVEISDLSDERIHETIRVIQDNVPFHAVLFALNVTGAVKEFLPPPAEETECYANMTMDHVVLSGSGQMVFNRGMEPYARIARDLLATGETVVTDSGTGYHQRVVLFSPDADIDRLDVTENILEVLAPSSNAGSYEVNKIDTRHAEIVDTWDCLVQSPLDVRPFTFRLSSLLYSNTSTDIAQADRFSFADDGEGFQDLLVKTKDEPGGKSWKISFEGIDGDQVVTDLMPDGSIEIADHKQLLPKTGYPKSVTYVLKNGLDETMASGTGTLDIRRGAVVDFGSARDRGTETPIDDIRNLVDIGDYALIDAEWYLVSGFVTGHPRRLLVDGYEAGDAVGQSVAVYRRVADGAVGSFQYDGAMLTCGTNYEQSLGIMNGDNPPEIVLDNNSFIQDFIVQVGDDYYAISGISGKTMSLSGPPQSWPTIDAGGEAVSFSIVKYTKEPFSVPAREHPTIEAHDFNQYDRSGAELVIAQIEEDEVPNSSFVVSMLNTQGSGTVETARQSETVKVNIELFDD